MDTDDQSAMIPPRYQRLSDELAEAIHGGRLPVGSRLPSLRQMALQRRLSLNTVIAAYRQLEDAGLVIPRPKAGFEVAPRLSVPERSLRDTPSAPTAPLQQVLMARVLEAQRRSGVIDLAFAGPRGRQFYPGAQLARHTAQVLRHGQQTVETYARPNGSPRLLAQIVRRGPRMGLHTHSERLLLTHGAMEALQLALRAVTQPGDAVGIEAPSYFNLYPLLANLGLQAIELPTHPQHGLDVDALDALLEHTPLAALVVMPTVHNPLGCTMPTPAKQRLAELVNARQLPLIEDAVYAELQFCEPPAPLLKAFDRDGWVMVVGGFSKTLAPDYRIGWLDGGRFAERIALLKFQSTGGEPQLLGDAVAAYLEAGSYEHHLHRMRRLYREQVGRLRQLVAEHFPAGTRATEPQGGFLLWLELPGVDTRELFERALAEDIVFMPGQVYSRGARYRHCLRLSCCQTLDARFIGAVERLGAIAKELAAAALPRITRAGTRSVLRHPLPADTAAAPSTASAGAAATSQWNDWVRLRGSWRLRHGNAGRWPATSGSPGGCSCRPAAGTTQGHSSRCADSASPSAPGRYGSRPQHGIGRRCCNVAMFSSWRCITGSMWLPIQPRHSTPLACCDCAVSRAWLTQPSRMPTTNSTGSCSARTRSSWSSVAETGASQPPTPSTTTTSACARRRANAATICASSTCTPSSAAASSGASGCRSAYGFRSA